MPVHRQAQRLGPSAAWRVQQSPARKEHPRKRDMTLSLKQTLGKKTWPLLVCQAVQLVTGTWRLVVRRRCSNMMPATI